MTTKNKLLEKIDETNQKISNSPIIKGLIDGGLSLIPVLGSAISSSLDTRALQLFEENSRKFAEEIHRIVDNIDENKLDKNFLESQEFTSLLIETLTHNSRAHEEEKIRLFAKIFAGFVTIKGAQIHYKEGFVRIIDELSAEHMKILAFILNRTKNPIETDDKLKNRVQAQDVSAELNITNERAQAYCDQMIRYGLLRDWSIGKFGYKPGNYALTGYGYEFAEFLISSLNE